MSDSLTDAGSFVACPIPNGLLSHRRVVEDQVDGWWGWPVR